MQRTASWWWVPGVAAIVWLLQFVRNAVPPFADLTLSFDGDIALHLLLGDLMIQQGGWLATEPTNFVMEGQPFIAHEWLSELVLALSYRAFGLAGPTLLTALIVATLAVQMLRKAQRDGAGTWPAVIVLVAAMMVQNSHMHPRPHLITWWFGFLFVSWCDDLRVGRLTPRSWLLRSAALVLLWAQLHAGFLVVGPILLAFAVGGAATAWSSDDARPGLRLAATYVLGGLGLLLLTGVNPWGFALHAHFLAWLGNDYMTSFTTEFQSPDFRGTAGHLLLVDMVLLWLGLAGSKQRPAASWLFLALGMNVMALHSARHGALFATFTMPFTAVLLQRSITDLARTAGPIGRVFAAIDTSSAGLTEAEGQRGGWGLVAAIGLTVTVAVGIVHTPEVRFHPQLQPVEAVDWIEAHPDVVEGRMFNPFRWGAYLAWRLYPAHKTFMNSWHDHLGEEVMRTYFTVHDVDAEWERVLKRNQISWVIYETHSALAQALDADEEWTMVHRDPTASVWVRERVGR